MNKYNQKQLEGTSYVPIDKGIVVPVKSNFDLYFISDWHCGATECNYALAKNIIKEIQENPRAVVVVGGDMIEGIPNNYYIDNRYQDTTPDTQIVVTAKQFKPIKKKIVAWFKGNHNTHARGESVDSDFLMAQMLEVPYKTVPTVVQFKGPNTTILAAGGHGSSGGRNGDLELEKLRNIFPGCGIYFLGHNHMLYAKHYGALKYDDQGNEDWLDCWFVRTGNCLDYAEYARYSMYAPQRSGCVKFIIRKGVIKDAEIITSDKYLK